MQRLLPLHDDTPHPTLRILSATGTQAYRHCQRAARRVARSPYLLPVLVVAAAGGLAFSGPIGAIALVGLAVGVGFYLHQINRLRVRWFPWRRWWRPANRPLTRAVLVGGGVFLLGLGLVLMWRRSPWPGLLTLVMAQTLAMALLLRGTPPRPSSPAQGDEELDEILTALAADHPIQQLVAIRQALRLAAAAADPGTTEAIAAGFTLLLRRTQDPEIRRFLQRGLAQIQPTFAPPARTPYEAATPQPAQFALQPDAVHLR